MVISNSLTHPSTDRYLEPQPGRSKCVRWSNVMIMFLYHLSSLKAIVCIEIPTIISLGKLNVPRDFVFEYVKFIVRPPLPTYRSLVGQSQQVQHRSKFNVVDLDGV